MLNQSTLTTDVVIIGGGATGCGILRDCALRGIRAILIERDDFASGTTGRNHGLLHSGARYAVTDHESASECIQENKILKFIARHCIEDTEGLFITLPEDDMQYQRNFVDACERAGIDTEILTPQQTLAFEPSVNPTLQGAVKVPDGTLDPFRLCIANVLDAQAHGNQVLTKTEVIGLIESNGEIQGVHCRDKRSHHQFSIYAKHVVNAAGVWGQTICDYANLGIKMFPAKGALLILDHRLNNVVINRCRKPADADILVPGDTISLIGTTSTHVNYDEIEHLTVTAKEVDTLIEEGSKLAPRMRNARILRAYAGVRPLVSINGDSDGREISRGIVLVDHELRDSMKGFTTITGGKLMTYRLMAEMATDNIAQKLGVSAKCTTAQIPLPGSRETRTKNTTIAQPVSVESAFYRHGENAALFANKKSPVVCECEMVTESEIRYAVQKLNVDNLVDLRRRTRVGMGPCQGELCSYRAAGLLSQYGRKPEFANQQLVDVIEERWKGNRPICWGEAMRETEFNYWIYGGLFGLQSTPPETAISLTATEQEESL